MKKFALKILSEMIPVILGILIALWINNYAQKRSDAAFLDHALSSIQNEHEENIQELKDVISAHELAMDSISHYIEDEEVSLGDLLSQLQGFQMALILNTSWQALLNTNIQLIDFRLISNLSAIDNYADAYEAQGKEIASFFLANALKQDYETKLIFLTQIGDILYTERELLESHQEYAEILKSGN